MVWYTVQGVQSPSAHFDAWIFAICTPRWQGNEWFAAFPANDTASRNKLRATARHWISSDSESLMAGVSWHHKPSIWRRKGPIKCSNRHLYFTVMTSSATARRWKHSASFITTLYLLSPFDTIGSARIPSSPAEKWPSTVQFLSAFRSAIHQKPLVIRSHKASG